MASYEYGQVDEQNNLVAPTPRYYDHVLTGAEIPLLQNGQPSLRPVVVNEITYDSSKQKLSGGFVYAVDGSLVTKTPSVVDLTADEIAAQTLDTHVAQYRQTYPYPETQLAVIGRVAKELLRCCDLLTGVNQQPQVTQADRDALSNIVVTAGANSL